MIPISTQKYKDGGVMEKSLVDLTVSMRNLKTGMTTTEVKDIYGAYICKVTWF